MLDLQVLTPDDWPTWRELRLRALADAPYAFGSTLADWRGEGDQETRWRHRLSLAGSHNLVALLDGVPVGMATGVPVGEGSAAVISMWVAPEARGRGVGGRLLDAIADWARAFGARDVRLAVVEDNEPAAALYQRKGFKFTGELGDVMPDGIRQELIMAREL